MRLELKDITKTFPGVLANDRISISADRGEVLGLLGENGAGKSHPDEHPVRPVQAGLGGDPHRWDRRGPSRTRARRSRPGSGWCTSTSSSSRCSTSSRPSPWARRACRGSSAPSIARPPASASWSCPSTYNLNVNPDAKIEDLPVGVRQRVEILKALYRQSDILVLDEPSAVLTPFETEELFGIIRGLAEAGTTVIFITHKLNEVLEVADKITVLRRGRGGRHRGPEDRHPRAARQPDGRPRRRAARSPRRPPTRARSSSRSANLHVRDDRGHMAVQDVNLEIRAGEIVALAGVQGNGQTELVEAIVGLRQVDSGEINLDAHSIKSVSPRHISNEGVAHIPEDRNRDGLIAT